MSSHNPPRQHGDLRTISSPETPADQLANLAEQHLNEEPSGWDRNVLAAILANPNCTAATVERISHSTDPYIVLHTLGHPKLPAAALARLARREEMAILCRVGAHPDTTPGDLARLAAYESWPIRAAVAANPTCPVGTLSDLASDHTFEVFSVAARNPACPPEALVRLLNGHRVDMRRAAVGNPNAPAAALRRLTEDPDESPTIRDRARRTLLTQAARRLDGAPRLAAEHLLRHDFTGSEGDLVGIATAIGT